MYVASLDLEPVYEVKGLCVGGSGTTITNSD
jgi:hypothetical protein